LQHALEYGAVHRKQAKVLLVGESQAGKTCCMRALSNKPFEHQAERTDGADIETLTICCNATDPSAPSCWKVAQHISFAQHASGVVDTSDINPSSNKRRRQFTARDYDQYHKAKQAKQASTTATTNNEMTTVQRSMESDATTTTATTTEQQELESIRLQLWDFAGQEIYYNTHQV
jgi:GTPase SAR1 family protein